MRTVFPGINGIGAILQTAPTAASEFDTSLKLERSVSGFGGKDSKTIHVPHKTQVRSSSEGRKPYGESGNRMIEDIPRIDTQNKAPGFGDPNTFFHRHIRCPRAQTLNA